MILRLLTYLISIVLLLQTAATMVSCKNKDKQQLTPWGTAINEDGTPVDEDSTQGSFSLEDIINHGEMIMLTMPGPDTYYDYHGHGMGRQYMLCETYTSQLGVKLRVEVCRDTTEMVSRLEKGEGDIIVTSGQSGNSVPSGLKKLKNGWMVSAKNTSLAENFNEWYKPSLMAKVNQEMQLRLANGGVTRHVYAPMINLSKGIISNYDGLFQKYAPVARLDWRLIAAQCYQESCFDPRAHSWAGACGLMQIIPATAAHLGLSMANLYSPEENISAGVRYMRELLGKFDNAATPLDRLCLALAAYNAGPQHIYDAQALARKYGRSEGRWADIREFVLKLQQPRYYNDPVAHSGYMRGSETANYVDRIILRWGQYRGHSSGSIAPSSIPSGGGIGLPQPRPSSRPNRFTK